MITATMLVTLFVLGPSLPAQDAPESPSEEVRRVLLDYLEAGRIPDAERLYGHLAEDVILLGTAPEERWTKQEFIKLSAPRMAAGKGWPSKPLEQNVRVAPNGKLAWFDERIEKPVYGEMRRSGVLRKDGQKWHFVQINHVFPVANSIVPELMPLIRVARQPYEGPDPACLPTFEPDPDDPQKSARAVLIELQNSAALAHFRGYFDCLAADVVFLGTDPTERFLRQDLEAFIRPYFDRGAGWRTLPFEQNVYLAEAANLAWFDERLWSTKHGEFRATGVLRRKNGRFEIVHYNLGFVIPNQLAAPLGQMNRGADRER